MKNRIALITDSTCDMPDHLMKQYDIRFVPIYLIWDGDQYRDQVDITFAEFYKQIKSSATLPSTSQPTPEDFLNEYMKAIDDGAEEIVVMTISSKMSGTLKSAQAAAEGLNLPIHFFDCGTGGTGVALHVMAAARAREAGADVKGIMQALEDAHAKMHFVFFVDSLEALHRGGRIGRAAKLIASALNLKPVLYANPLDGEVTSGARTRTRKRALRHIFEDFSDFAAGKEGLHVLVCHSGTEADANEMVDAIKEKLSPVEIFVEHISPVMGVHIGPDAVGISGYYEFQ